MLLPPWPSSIIWYWQNGIGTVSLGTCVGLRDST